jgi:hypothetical protein
MAAPHGARRLLRQPEEEARADHCLGQRGTRPRLPHQRPGKRMKPAINNASARQRAGGPPPFPSRGDDWENWPRSPIEVKRQIAELVDRSTQDLRVAWRELHRTGPPQGLSRDLLIRALAHRLQEQTHGGTSRAQRRRLQTLAREFEKGSGSSDPGIVLRTGTTLVRQWRGHTHTVLVREDGFEYEGQHYRSLTVIAERITGAHWSGPRFFGLTKRASALIGAEAGR